MASVKYNEFLDTGDSESDEAVENESDIENIRKGGRISKRRKVETSQSDDEESNSDDEKAQKVLKETTDKEPKEPSKENGKKSNEIPGISKPLLKKNLVVSTEAIKRSGVVYLSRIPPYMKASKLRSLLEPYGAINRIFLTPEDESSHSRRKRNGGNKKKSFVDGWVEFVKKSEAKIACDLLNARIIGGKKGTYYHDDVWNLLYLKGFKWNNLTEQIVTENAERASRMRAEISKTKKENKEFLKNVERAKVLQGMEAKRSAKSLGKESREVTETEKKPAKNCTIKETERARTFRQKSVASKNVSEAQPEQIKSILRKIF